MIGPLSRIIVRYLAGALVAWGWIGHETGGQVATDPDIIMAVGLALGVVAEAFYVIARKVGWST